MTEYEFDPDRSRQLLQQAGLTLPVEVEFWYPTEVTRDYMPDPKRNFEAFAAQPQRSGLQGHAAHRAVAPGLRGDGQRGQRRPPQPHRLDRRLRRPRQLHRDVLPVALGSSSDSTNPEIHDLLDRGRAGDRPGAAGPQLYEQANRMIMENSPACRTCTRQRALAFEANIQGFVPSPVGVGGESFATVAIADRGRRGRGRRPRRRPNSLQRRAVGG